MKTKPKFTPGPCTNTFKRFTVVSLCGCGCEDSLVDWVESATAITAAQRAKNTRPGLDIKVIAIFAGHLKDRFA